MKAKEYREVIKTLKAHGFYKVRTNGSHEQYKNDAGINVPVKCTEKMIPIGTLKRIEKITGIKF